MEYNKEQQKVLDRIESCEERLSQADNNLKYIINLKLLKILLDRFANLLNPEERLQSAEYMAMFHTGCGWCLYDRVCCDLQGYEYGERPF